MKKTFECEATIEKLSDITAFVESQLEEAGCNMKVTMQLTIALEEIYVNIAHYAYAKLDENGKTVPDTGTGPMKLTLDLEDDMVRMIFEDHGIPYNPLQKPDPDITLSADDRDIGGLGIYMVKQSMDDVTYRNTDGTNILTLMKKL